MKIFSLHSIIDKLDHCSRRFPITIAFLLVLTVFLVIITSGKLLFPDQFQFFIIYYSSTAAILSLSLKLWSEEVKNRTKSTIVQAVVHAMWLASAIYLMQLIPIKYELPLGIAVLSANVLVVLSVWLLSFFNSSTDLPLWNFMLRTTVGAVISAGIGVILYLLLLLLFRSFEMLFGLEMGSKTFEYILIIDMCFIAPLIFLQTIPAGEAKHDERVNLAKFPRAVTRYILTPITAAYLITLYVYAAKILFQWQLPNGWVSYLVATLMALMLVIIFLIYPTRHEEGQKFNHFIMRWLPVMVLPLLALMSIGVMRRLSDYGITIFRLYLILFNLWCYVVCIGLFLTRSRRFGWIIASFGLVLFLTSVGPWSMGNITRRTLTQNVTQAFKQAGFQQLPLDSAQYERLAAKLPLQEMQEVDSKLDYLRLNCSSKSIDCLVDSTVIIGIYTYPDMVSTEVQQEVFYQHNLLANNALNIPEGYTKFKTVSCDCNYESNGDDLNFVINDQGRKYHFTVSRKQLIMGDKATERNGLVMALKAREGDLLYVDSFSLDTNQKSIAVDGFLFMK